MVYESEPLAELEGPPLLATTLVLGVFSVQSQLALRNARREFTRELEEEKRQAQTPPANPGTPPEAADSAAKNVTPPNSEPAAVETSGPPTQSGSLIGPLFSAFGPGTLTGIEEPGRLAIAVKNAQTNWSGKTLVARFEIHYTHDDGGNQQGRIFLLARGPNHLLVHPQGAFEPAGSAALIGIKKGEHFSVSRLRAVEARFEGVAKSEIQSVQTLIVSDDGTLLIHEALPIK